MVVERLIKQTDSKITDDMYKRADELGYTMNEILTMASIIQMEAGQSTESMADVAERMAVEFDYLNRVPERLQCYIGYEAWGRDLALEGTFLKGNRFFVQILD